MNYRELKPSGFLTNFIESFWEYKTNGIDCEHTIIPDGYFDLITTFKNSELDFIKLTGVWTKPMIVYISKPTTLFGIRFKLLATEYLFYHDIQSILNASENLPSNFWNIDQYESADFEKFVEEISKRLENSMKHLKEIDKRKLNLFELVYSKPNLSVKEISQQIFWSSRQINRYFNQQFGFSLKVFLNIVRCNASYKDISNGNLHPNEHYFDQAHFIKEIKKHTGATPTELLKNKNDRFIQLTTKSEN